MFIWERCCSVYKAIKQVKNSAKSSFAEFFYGESKPAFFLQKNRKIKQKNKKYDIIKMFGG